MRSAHLARWVQRHRVLVIVGWLIVGGVGIASTSKATAALSTDFSLPGRPVYEANRAIARAYGNGGPQRPIVAVVALPPGVTAQSQQVTQELRAALEGVGAALPGARTASWATTKDPAFVADDGRTTFALIYPPLQFGPDGVEVATEQLRPALESARVAGQPILLTSLDELAGDSGSGEGGGGVWAETLFGAVGALVVLLFLFGSALALLPMVVAAITIPTTFLLVWGVAGVTDVNVMVQYLIALLGLGIAIDYALLLAVRWREERARGADNQTAIVEAMTTAGTAVVFSGSTVAIGLAALIALPIPFLRGVGYAGLLIATVSVLVTITLLPALLGVFGARLDWPRRRLRPDRLSRAWAGWARLVIRGRWVAAVLVTALLAALLVPAMSIRLGTPRPDALSSAGPAQPGLDALERAGLGAGPLQPVEVLVDDPTQAAAVAGRLAQVEGVQAAIAPEQPDWRQGGTALAVAVLADAPGSEPANATIGRLADLVPSLPGGARLGGPGPQSAEFTETIYANFPLMLTLIIVATLVLLIRAFRSVVLPVKATVINLLSLIATWGVLVLVWQEGYGSELIWGIPATGSISEWIPIAIFAFLFGLSMDYEVFILSRMREEYDRTGSTNQAIVGGIARTGRLVTGAALILFLAFVSMASLPSTELKIAATGLAVGIMLDATVVRTVLVPALVAIFDRANWWLPDQLARLLRVASPAPAHPGHTGPSFRTSTTAQAHQASEADPADRAQSADSPTSAG